MDDASDCLKALRLISSQRPKSIHWRDRYPYLIGDRMEYQNSSIPNESGTLLVSGYIRGSALSANQLIHIPEYGDFQIEKIVSCPLQSSSSKNKDDSNGMTCDSELILDTPDQDRQESLLSENIPDPMEGEQTWPTDEEILEAQGTLFFI